MAGPPPGPGGEDEPLPLRRPWLAALMLGSVATPAAVVISVPAPPPIDALFAWPLVLMDRWVGGAGPLAEIVAAIVGIAFTWAWYVVLARILIRRFAPRGP